MSKTHSYIYLFFTSVSMLTANYTYSIVYKDGDPSLWVYVMHIFFTITNTHSRTNTQIFLSLSVPLAAFFPALCSGGALFLIAFSLTIDYFNGFPCCTLGSCVPALHQSYIQHSLQPGTLRLYIHSPCPAVGLALTEH